MAVAARTTNSDAPVWGEEIEIDKWWANRRGEAIITKLVEINGRWFIDIRRHFTNSSGKFSPTQTGVMLPVRKIPDLARSIAKAERAAQERGFLAHNDGAEG